MKPNVYVYGARPEIVLSPLDIDGNPFVPDEARLTIDAPNGTITVSGAQMTQDGDYLTYIYTPTTSGYFAYEAWVADTTGRETAEHNGFYVIDRIY